MIGPFQRPLLDNTQHSQREAHPCPMTGFEPAVPVSQLPPGSASTGLTVVFMSQRMVIREKKNLQVIRRQERKIYKCIHIKTPNNLETVASADNNHITGLSI